MREFFVKHSVILANASIQSIFVIPSETRNLSFLVFGFASYGEVLSLCMDERKVPKRKPPLMPWPKGFPKYSKLLTRHPQAHP
jgi:hypothetical protein